MITRITLLALALALFLVLLAIGTGTDPLGMTTREHIRSDTAITVADIEADRLSNKRHWRQRHRGKIPAS